MCISSSVSSKDTNNRFDVKTVQILINLNSYRLTNYRPLAEDGIVGKNTIKAIENFQRQILHMSKPDAQVAPNGTTLINLQQGMPVNFSEAKLRGIMIHASRIHTGKYFQIINQKMMQFDINTPLRKAHFLAQLGHESGELRYSEEVASGDAYEGRLDLGNTQPGDGRRFKGRGLIQLTGRANYTSYGNTKEVDYTTDGNNGLLATDATTAVDVSCWFWVKRNLNESADRDDITAITRKINGGYNGIANRKALLARAKFFLMAR